MPTDSPILVTGATGLVGSTLARALLDDGLPVRIFRRETSDLDLLGEAAQQVEHAVGDLRDARSLLRAMEGVEHVYHAAAKVSFNPRDRNALREVNVDGTGNVVNAAMRTGVDRLLHTSSMAAFGRPLRSDATIDETTEWNDGEERSAYARSKFDSELEIHRGIAEGLDAVIVNPSLIFGTGRPGGNTRRIVDVVRSGWARAVPPGGTNVVDVRDVAAGMRRAMEHGDTGRRYFLGSENLSWTEIAGTLADAFGVRPPSRTIPKPLISAAASVTEAVGFVTRTRPLLPQSMARTSTETFRYDNTRARRELDCTFRPFQETAFRIAADLEGR
jgi:dihydroflavonol-4-reductase